MWSSREIAKVGQPFCRAETAVANQINTVTKHSQDPKHQSKCYNCKNIALNNLKTSLAECTINPKKSTREKLIA